MKVSSASLLSPRAACLLRPAKISSISVRYLRQMTVDSTSEASLWRGKQQDLDLNEKEMELKFNDIEEISFSRLLLSPLPCVSLSPSFVQQITLS